MWQCVGFDCRPPSTDDFILKEKLSQRMDKYILSVGTSELPVARFPLPTVPGPTRAGGSHYSPYITLFSSTCGLVLLPIRKDFSTSSPTT